MILWEETKITDEKQLVSDCKKIFEGSSIKCNKKHQDGFWLERTPVLCTSNYTPWEFVKDERTTFENRMFYLTFYEDARLEPLVKHLNPLFWVDITDEKQLVSDCKKIFEGSSIKCNKKHQDGFWLERTPVLCKCIYSKAISSNISTSTFSDMLEFTLNTISDTTAFLAARLAFHAWHFCTRNCRFKMSRFFSQPCRIFWSLVTNLILEKFPKFIEKMLVRVFLYGDLRAIGRLRVSRGSK